MSSRTIFDEIIDGNVPSWKVWEDDNYLAFLTPFANTPGVTVVIPKVNPGDYFFSLDVDTAHGLIDAATKVSKLLEKALGVQRVAMVFEGEAVPHVHAKLYPMHNVEVDRSQFPKQQVFFPMYPGFISTIEGPKMDEERLNDIQRKIQEAANEN